MPSWQRRKYVASRLSVSVWRKESPYCTGALSSRREIDTHSKSQ